MTFQLSPKLLLPSMLLASHLPLHATTTQPPNEINTSSTRNPVYSQFDVAPSSFLYQVEYIPDRDDNGAVTDPFSEAIPSSTLRDMVSSLRNSEIMLDPNQELEEGIQDIRTYLRSYTGIHWFRRLIPVTYSTILENYLLQDYADVNNGYPFESDNPAILTAAGVINYIQARPRSRGNWVIREFIPGAIGSYSRLWDNLGYVLQRALDEAAGSASQRDRGIVPTLRSLAFNAVLAQSNNRFMTMERPRIYELNRMREREKEEFNFKMAQLPILRHLLI